MPNVEALNSPPKFIDLINITTANLKMPSQIFRLVIFCDQIGFLVDFRAISAIGTSLTRNLIYSNELMFIYTRQFRRL